MSCSLCDSSALPGREGKSSRTSCLDFLVQGLSLYTSFLPLDLGTGGQSSLAGFGRWGLWEGSLLGANSATSWFDMKNRPPLWWVR